MSSTRISDGFPGGQRRSYIATDNFQAYFFNYTVVHDRLITTGDITVPVTTDCTKTPQGRVLRENGRKLYPVANPGVKKFYVGVYDSVTFLSGYIDPNDSVFAIHNSDRPTYIPNQGGEDSSDEETEGSVDPDYGPPVYTTGDITTVAGNVVALNQAGGSVIGVFNRSTIECDDSTNLIFNNNVYSFGAICGYPGSSTILIKAIDVSNGLPGTGAVMASDGTITNSGLFYPTNAASTVQLVNGTTDVLYHPLMNSHNRVMLTHQYFNGTPGVLYCSASDDGSYYISSSTQSDNGSVHYLILGVANVIC